MYSKFKNKITEVDGIKFRSKKEAKRYSELMMLRMAGKIFGFQMQVPFVVARDGKKTIKYYADFVVTWPDSIGTTVEDTKGMITPLYKLKKMLVKEKYGIEIVEI